LILYNRTARNTWTRRLPLSVRPRNCAWRRTMCGRCGPNRYSVDDTRWLRVPLHRHERDQWPTMSTVGHWQLRRI